MKLVIVESPTKAKTIARFLGKDYEVLSSFGHIRDLPKSKLGIDPDKDFEPTYVIPTKARTVVTKLKKEAAKADSVILASDEDREGEAIAFHLKEALGLKDPERIVFHEITKGAIEHALESPRKIDMNLVNAQQARRALDRLVGYKLSPFLWKKVARRLSAGRVQSAAVRLVAEREKEIRAFNPQEYWSIGGIFSGTARQEFPAQLQSVNGVTLDKFAIPSKEEADKLARGIEKETFSISSVERKPTFRNPLPPFTTSTMQQTSSQRLRMIAKATMSRAQRLYETGAITYHRTDSLNLSEESLKSAASFIQSTYGASYYDAPRKFKTKSRGAQEAHEAIRPTNPQLTPEEFAKQSNLGPGEIKLYELVWRRFVASQMKPAEFASVRVDIASTTYGFKATGQTLRFDGFLATYPMKFEESSLPELAQGEALKLASVTPDQHFTEPPPRYTEATLVKALESFGIGRPSTYAPILSTIQERNYVEKDERRRFVLTSVGEAVDNLLTEHFPSIVDIAFTAKMEDALDEVAQGTTEWIPVLREFYTPFAATLAVKEQEVKSQKIQPEETDKTCPQCNSPVVIRWGRFGKFYSCSAFPECKYTAPLNQVELSISCPSCKQGMITQKRTKRKRLFYSCNRYPECTFALWDKPTGEKCAQCDSLLVQSKGGEKCSGDSCPSNKKE